MSTLAEIKIAADRLPPMQQEKLFAFLAGRLRRNVGMKARRALKVEEYPPLEGLPTDLSIGTKQQVRALVAKRHAANR